MTEVLTLYAIMLVSATALTLIAIYRGPAWAGFALIMYAVVLVVSYASFETLLSRPKPIQIELFAPDEPVELLHFTFEEGKAIYVMVQLKTPRLYTLPWSEETAKQLQDATGEAEKNGTSVLMKLKNHNPDTEEPQFWAVPVMSDRPPK